MNLLEILELLPSILSPAAIITIAFYARFTLLRIADKVDLTHSACVEEAKICRKEQREAYLGYRADMKQLMAEFRKDIKEKNS